MSNNELQAIGELAMRINMVRLQARDTEEKLQRQRKAIKRLVLIVQIQSLALLLMALALLMEV